MLTTFTVQLELRLLVNEADDLTPLACSPRWSAWTPSLQRGCSSRVGYSEQWNCNSCFPKYCKMLRRTSNFLYSVFYISLKYLVSFTMYVHPFTTALNKEVSPQNRHLRLCPKECVLIFAQIKENKLCTHSRFFICRQTSLFSIWNFCIRSLLEAQMAQVSAAKSLFFCNQTRANLEFSLGLKRHSRKKIKKNNLFFLSFFHLAA